ncbi:hypothetical protein HAX54_044022 [Datura stramonium]|uniref:Uncharacterized protein n=1 Tax=Datura stramonium TaxID=4076 RepID=A0ABS8W3Y7_DATST|nr:hypothetical protein [Datura stramonium]
MAIAKGGSYFPRRQRKLSPKEKGLTREKLKVPGHARAGRKKIGHAREARYGGLEPERIENAGEGPDKLEATCGGLWRRGGKLTPLGDSGYGQEATAERRAGPVRETALRRS